MGLDITAYRQLVPAPDAEVDEDGYPKDWQHHFRPGAALTWSEDQWPGRCPELSEGTVYRASESFDFRAGSYSGYNEFRSALSRLVGYASDRDYWNRAPEGTYFYALINFADNEGTIGATTAAQLARDFADCQESADRIGGWFSEIYAKWRKATEIAADGGAINFH